MTKLQRISIATNLKADVSALVCEGGEHYHQIDRRSAGKSFLGNLYKGLDSHMGVYDDGHCYSEHFKQSRWQGIEPKQGRKAIVFMMKGKDFLEIKGKAKQRKMQKRY